MKKKVTEEAKCVSLVYKEYCPNCDYFGTPQLIPGIHSQGGQAVCPRCNYLFWEE